ncbi:MAG TPA: hydroxymethylbilane synthase [Actinomycetes bacterium]|nr:hydroxymethylbilane synthase [Actinomycetes bacterium]
MPDKPAPVKPAPDEPSIRIATRGSALALAQSRLVADGLATAWPGLQVVIVPVVTEGDRRRDVPTTALGGKGVFTAAVQEAVLDGRADLAVHSAKDLPAAQVPGLVLAAVPEREDPRDVLVTRQPEREGPRDVPVTRQPERGPAAGDLDRLPRGARVGTGSPRRLALLSWLRPDLEVVGVRGNVDSRVRRVRSGELDAAVLAAAGLRRLGLAEEAAAPLDPEVFTPAPGQGCLAVEAREDDTRVLGLLGVLTHRPSRVALRGERAFLARLGGSCTLPAGALLRAPEPDSGGRLEIQGFLAAADGKGLVRERLLGPPDDPEGLGQALADRLLAACGPEVRALVEASRR